MCRLRNIAMSDYQESVTTGQTDTRSDGRTDVGLCDPYVPLCFAGDTTKLQKICLRQNYFDRQIKNTCVCETLCPRGQQSPKKLFLIQRAKSMSLLSFERVSLAEYVCQI